MNINGVEIATWNGVVLSEFNGVPVSAGPVAPTVDAGGPYVGDVSTAIQLDATVTPGSDPSPVLLWTEPSGLGGTFSNTAIEDPTFTPDIESAAYSLQLSADPSDGPAVTDTATLDSQTGAGLTVYLEDNFTGPEADFFQRIPDTVDMGEAWKNGPDRFGVDGAGRAGCISGQNVIRNITLTGGVELDGDSEYALDIAAALLETNQYGVYFQHEPAASRNNPNNFAGIDTTNSEIILRHTGVEVGRAAVSSMVGELLAKVEGTTQTVTLNEAQIQVTDRTPTGFFESGMWSNSADSVYAVTCEYYKASAP